MRQYKCLRQNEYVYDNYRLVPIREEDKFLIMKWRNEQMYHLRQNAILTESDQEEYFSKVISPLFKDELPNQLLFSYLKGNKCIGYGGLVHISWVHKHAEVSFLANTEEEIEFEHDYWTNFLRLINLVAFEDLNLVKIFAYAYDVRPHLYKYLLNASYVLEARLKDHHFLGDKFVDVVIHSKFRSV